MKVKGLVFLLCVFAPLSEASFQMQPRSVKAVSLGKAFMANGNESSVVFMNPAGIANISSSELSLIYAKPFAGLGNINLGLGSLAFTVPSKMGNFGLDDSIAKMSILPDTTSYVLSSLSAGSTYFFRVTAYDTSGNESAFNIDFNELDVEVSTYIAPAPSPAPPTPEPEPDPPIVRILPKVSFDLDMGSGRKYFQGNLAQNETHV